MNNPIIIGKATLYHGDCLEVMRTMPDCSVDSIVTDPPYGIRFMGKAWDGADIEKKTAARRNLESHCPGAGPNGGHKSVAAEAGKYELTPKAMRAFQEFSRAWAVEALRILKPGGHLLSFSSARTYHRMVCGIEDAGFEIRDQIMWVFGSGFPKSHNLTDDWKGWGTALKPAHEPICVARKPLIGTVAENVLQHGTGALNIDACRIELNGDYKCGANGRPSQTGLGDNYDSAVANQPSDVGRWPANLIHNGSEEVLACFPDSNGQQGAVTGDEPSSKTNAVYGDFNGRPASQPRNDAGSAARFYYCAKASRADRNEGCEGMPEKIGGMVSNTSGQHITRRDGGAPGPRANHHPTVKPTELMQYLIRLVTQPGGTTLDCFMGSGSTGKAAILEGFKFIGIEQDEDENGNPLGYIDIATGRIEHAIKTLADNTAQQEMFA